MFKTKKNLVISLIFAQLLFANSALAFTDVNSQSSYSSAIEYWTQKGAIKGYSDGSFQPEKQVTKAEFFTILLNSKEDQTYIDTSKNTFKDVPTNAWYFGTAEKALKLGLITKNDADPYFYPNDNITKAKALEYIMTFYNTELLAVSDGERIFTDVNSTHTWGSIAKTSKKYGIFEQGDNSYFKAFKAINRGELADYLYKIDTFASNTALNYQARDINNVDYDSTIFKDKNFNILVDIWNRLHSDYLYKTDLDDSTLLRGAIEGLLNELDDPYTTYQTPSQAQEFDSNLNGNLQGIGVEIHKNDADIVITSVIKGSPAEKAGVFAKDILTKINGESLIGKTMQEIAEAVRGEVGTQIKITVQRGQSTKNFTITREKISIPEVSGQILDSNVGYISISLFSFDVGIEFGKVIADLQNQGAQAFVIDLRNNPGGYLTSSIDILDYILPKGKTATTIYTVNNQSNTHFSQGPSTLSALPLAIIVNQGSASASEIVAAAVKEHKVGKIIGTTTYGKGTVQDISYYTDGSFFKMTLANWLTPSGANIDQIGVVPDITVNNISTGVDAQLKRAIDVVKKEI